MQDSPEDGDEPDKSHTWTSAWTSTLTAHAVALIWAAPACLAAGWTVSALTGGGWLTADEPQWGAIAAAAAAGTLTWTLTYRMIPRYMEDLQDETKKDRRLEAGANPLRGGRNAARAARKDQRRRTKAGRQRWTTGQTEKTVKHLLSDVNNC